MAGLLWVLQHHDERFMGAISQSTFVEFAAWFVLCVAMTAANIWNIGNVAHGAGLIFGVLVGFALTAHEPLRRWAGAGIGLLLLPGIWGATVGRPTVNLSSTAGWAEAKWGYDALVAHRDAEAMRWLREAAALQPRNAAIWTDLGVAYDRLGKRAAAEAAYEQARRLKPNGGAASATPEKG